MVKYSSCLLILSVLFLLSSCGSTNKYSLFSGATYVNPKTIKGIYVENDRGQSVISYKIKINDLIAVRNIQNLEFGADGTESGASSTTPLTYKVDINGMVNLPAIGKVLLAGLTRSEATIKLEELYNASQVANPIIELTIANVRVTMLGEFNSKGVLLLERDNTTLVEMIAKAGGLTKDADPRTLKIIRGDKNPEIIHVNLTDMSILGNNKLVLQNNDIITIDATKNAIAAGKLQSFNNIIQPLLVIINLAVLVFTFTR